MARTVLGCERLGERVLPAAGLTAVGSGAGEAPTLAAFNPDGAERFRLGLDPAQFAGGVRVAVGDVNADGTPDIVAAPGPGARPVVRVFSGVGGAELSATLAFEESFTGGLFVAAGDFDGDGAADVVVTPDQGGGPRVRVLGGRGGVLADFFGIDDPAFRGGARASAGDIDGDGRADLVVAAGFGGGPRVAVYGGTGVGAGDPRHLAGDFFAFEPALRNGAYPASGDIDGDGRADLAFAAGPGGGPRVLAVSGARLLSAGPDAAKADALANFFAGDPESRTGARVAVTVTASGAAAFLVAELGGAVGAYSADGRPTPAPGVGARGAFVASGEALPLPAPVPVPPAPIPVPVPPPTPVPLPVPSPPAAFEDADWAYYVPSGLEVGRAPPVLFAFDPGGDAHAFDALLRPLAERLKWVVAGSKLYRNGSDLDLGMELNADGSLAGVGAGYASLRDAVARGLATTGGDPTRTVLFGFSGGGSVAHALSLAYPGLADALVVNTGMIWGDTIIGPNPGETGPTNGPPWNEYLARNAAALSTAFAAGGSRRLAAFLESPTDFRFEEMQADAPQLRAAGWAVNQFRFAGGHALAPADLLRQAADWIAADPAWG